jgi:hypothetical protein
MVIPVEERGDEQRRELVGLEDGGIEGGTGVVA